MTVYTVLLLDERMNLDGAMVKDPIEMSCKFFPERNDTTGWAWTNPFTGQEVVNQLPMCSGFCRLRPFKNPQIKWNWTNWRGLWSTNQCNGRE